MEVVEDCDICDIIHVMLYHASLLLFCVKPINMRALTAMQILHFSAGRTCNSHWKKMKKHHITVAAHSPSMWESGLFWRLMSTILFVVHLINSVYPHLSICLFSRYSLGSFACPGAPGFMVQTSSQRHSYPSFLSHFQEENREKNWHKILLTRSICGSVQVNTVFRWWTMQGIIKASCWWNIVSVILFLFDFIWKKWNK